MTDNIMGPEVLLREFRLEDDIERITDTFLEQGDLGKRAPRIYCQLGSCLSLLIQAASCAWACRGGDHIRENILRRFSNYTLACIRVAKWGLYDEAITELRALAELGNLIELFTVARLALQEWLSLPDDARWWRFRPKKVHERIRATRNLPIVDEATYKSLCELGVHITPSTTAASHQFDGTVHVGGQFSPMAFLMILNEIAITVSRVLLLAEHFIDVPQDKRSLVEAQARALEGSATGWVRITNYEERLREPSKGHE